MHPMPIKPMDMVSENRWMRSKYMIFPYLTIRVHNRILIVLRRLSFFKQYENCLCFYSHLKQHEKDAYVDFSKMTKPQIIMHHFRQFDQNKDGKVDGLEMLKKIQRDNGM